MERKIKKTTVSFINKIDMTDRNVSFTLSIFLIVLNWF